MSGTRVLVVDDEPQILRALQLKLRAAGYAVETAATASEARSRQRIRPPEAIILDLLLPDGPERTSAGSCGAGARCRSSSSRPSGRSGEDRRARRGRGRLRHEAVQRSTSCSRGSGRRCAGRAPRPSPSLEIGDLKIDLEKRDVTIGGEAGGADAASSTTCYALLAQNEGKLITHPTILREIWGPAYARGVELPPRVHLASPPQDRARSRAAAVHLEPAGRRLPTRRPGYSSWYGTLVRITRGSKSRSRLR